MASMFSFTESIKKVTIKYLIERFLGSFLSDDLDLSQLNVDLFQGTSSVDEIPLNVKTINDNIGPYLPVELLEGRVGRIELAVPWSSLWTDSCAVQLEGVRLEFCETKRMSHDEDDDDDDVTTSQSSSSILSKSMMASSMEMAEEILKEDSSSEQPSDSRVEGLERFAQLINSIIRRVKVTAKDTKIKLVLPPKQGSSGQDIEIRINSMRCEEDEINLANENTGDSDERRARPPGLILMSDVVTKTITLDGVELLINGRTMTKMHGTHTLQVRFYEHGVSMDAYLGSYIFAILNMDHVKTLQSLLHLLDDPSADAAAKKTFQPRQMGSEDYRLVQEIMRGEAKQTALMSGSIMSMARGQWTSGDVSMEDDSFMSFTSETSKKLKTKEESCAATKEQTSKFTCSLKVPGVVLCLLTDYAKRDTLPEMAVWPQIDTLIGINSYLNTELASYDHLRLLASNLCLKVASETVEFNSNNVSLYEYRQRDQVNQIILLTEHESAETLVPSITLKVTRNQVDISLAPTSLRLDPTMIERHFTILSLFERTSSCSSSPSSVSSSGSEEVAVNVECSQLSAELYFPIPDLRVDRDAFSVLHEEVLEAQLSDLSVRIEPAMFELLCAEATLAMRVDQHVRHRVLHATSEHQHIKLHVSTASALDDEPVTKINDDLLTSAMNESVNFMKASMINGGQDKFKTPFRVKRKLEDNPIETPGDQEHAEKYLEHQKQATKLYILIHIPYGEIHLEDKPLFELIYNRFANDLIFWKPVFPPPSEHELEALSLQSDSAPPTLILPSFVSLDDGYGGEDGAAGCEGNDQPPHFFNCNQLSESCESDGSFHSVIEHGALASGPSMTAVRLVNEIVLELEFDHLQLELFSATRKHYTLLGRNLLLGVVVGPETAPPNTVVTTCLESLMLKCDDRQLLLGNSIVDSANSARVNLAVDISRQPESLKKIKLAVQLVNAIVVGIEMGPFEELWEFVQVHDDEILGYICPKVVIELHADVMRSGVAFEHLSERPALLQCEDLYLTSMVIENTAQTMLRLFIEEALLCFKRNNYCSDTLKNYIAVIDSGMIDLSLRIANDGQLELFKVSNNELNVKVCPDSLATLCHFLQMSNTAAGVSESSSELSTSDPTDPLGPSTATNNGEIFMRRNSENGNNLIADALFECAMEEARQSELSSSMEKSSSSSLTSNTNNKMECDVCSGFGVEESTFHLLGEDDYGSGINLGQEPKIKTLVEDFVIVENHFTVPKLTTIPEMTSEVLTRYLLERMSLKVSLYAGKDFDDIPEDEESKGSKSRNGAISDAISQTNISLRSTRSATTTTSSATVTTTPTSTSGRGEQRVRFSSPNDFIDIDINSGSENCGPNAPPMNGYINTRATDSHFAFKSAGGAKRRLDTCVVLEMNRIKLLFDHFDPAHSMAWQIYFFVEQVEIIDRVNASKIKKILYEFFSEATPRRANPHMASIKLRCNRNFTDHNEECELNVSMKPLRINIDQDTLIFMMDFFATTNEILHQKFTTSKSASSSKTSLNDDSDSNTLRDEPLSNAYYSNNNNHEDDDDLMMMDRRSRNGSVSSTSSSCASGHTAAAAAGGGGGYEAGCGSSSDRKLFIKDFLFAPEVIIKLDYHGKHIDLNQGALPGIIMGLTELSKSELKLKRLSHKQGLLGLEKVLQYMVDEWAKDIKRNQLPTILTGIGPVHPIIQLVQGFRDLFWMPIEQYHRDRRIVRGLQRGAYAFSLSTAMATLDLASRLLSLITSTAQFAHDVMTPPGSTGSGPTRTQLTNRQPRSTQEGFIAATTLLRERITGIVEGVRNAHAQSNDVTSLLSAVIRHTPTMIVMPMIAGSEAANQIIHGLRNHMQPEAREDDQQKYKNANQR